MFLKCLLQNELPQWENKDFSTLYSALKVHFLIKFTFLSNKLFSNKRACHTILFVD